GADPNRLGGSNKETALHMSAKMGPDGAAIAELFLEHRADPGLADADGQTPYAVAIREGNTAVADVLLAHGAVAGSASPADQFIGACRRVDSGAAWSILRSQPDVLESIRSERGQLLDHAVIGNQLKAVKLMAELGLGLAAMSERGASPLHLAAWFGHQELVRLLVDYHAPVNLRDAVYRTSPLAWAAHGSRSSKNWREADDDYCAIVETLIDAGAEYQAACNSW